MRRRASIEICDYRGRRTELRNDGEEGWIVIIYARPGDAVASETLHNGRPGRLAVLLAEARQQVDRRPSTGLFRA